MRHWWLYTIYTAIATQWKKQKSLDGKLKKMPAKKLFIFTDVHTKTCGQRYFHLRHEHDWRRKEQCCDFVHGEKRDNRTHVLIVKSLKFFYSASWQGLNPWQILSIRYIKYHYFQFQAWWQSNRFDRHVWFQWYGSLWCRKTLCARHLCKCVIFAEHFYS